MSECVKSVVSIDQLAMQIAESARCIDVAKHRLLTRVREFDARNGWAGSGCVSMVMWLSWWTSTSAKAASEQLRVARALGRLPLIDQALAAGEISYSKARAITRVAEPESQQSLLDIAKSATASQLDRIIAGWRRAHAHQSGEVGSEHRRYARFRATEAGMVRLTTQLGPEEALIVQRALELAKSPAGDSAAPRAGESGHSHGADSKMAANATLSANSPAGELGTELADALVAVARGYLERQPTTRGTGCELIMMTTPEQVGKGPEGVGGFLRDGTPLPLHVARMLACDGQRVDISVGESGEILDVGRSRRTIPTAIGRALALRDGGCRVPGCGRSRHLQAHHVHAWAEGGETSVDNLVLLCPGHHWLVHEGHMRVVVREGELEFLNAHGLTMKAVPRHDLDEDVVASKLEAWLDEAQGSGDLMPTWDGSRLDLHEVVGWMMMAEGLRPG
jgi:hypothetical protein